MTPGKTMVFHAPFPLNPNATSASGLRPVRMRQAFAELGYEILDVTGWAAGRKRAIARVKARLAAGGAIDFAYSESSTMPTLLTDPYHLPLHPCLDHGFLRLLARNGVNVGLFYRDIYWCFPEYRQAVGKVLAAGTTRFYRHDLRAYNSYLTKLYVPSLEMGQHIPIVKPSLYVALPPGTDIVERVCTPRKGTLRLFYVGGLGSNYRLEVCAETVGAIPGVETIFCVPAANWEKEAVVYRPLTTGVTIVHESGSALQEYFAAADVGILYVGPQPYWTFAVPFKLFEYLGQGLPIIASAGTLAGQFVAEHGVGWTIPYGKESLAALLTHLRDHPEEIEAKAAVVRERATDHTWLARAAQVRDDLTGAGSA